MNYLNATLIGRSLGTLGITITLFGAWLIYRYTIPFRLPAAPDYLAAEDDPPATALAEDRRWSWLSSFGLAMTMFGALMQMAAIWLV